MVYDKFQILLNTLDRNFAFVVDETINTKSL